MLIPEPDGTPREGRMILDLSKLARLTVHPALTAVTTFPIDQRQADGYRREQQSCDRDATAVKSTMMGYEVVRNELRLPPNAPIHIPKVERWVAPALGCIALEATWTRDEG